MRVPPNVAICVAYAAGSKNRPLWGELLGKGVVRFAGVEHRA
jgi:hypothetical protein